jgi:hypothetical protein
MTSGHINSPPIPPLYPLFPQLQYFGAPTCDCLGKGIYSNSALEALRRTEGQCGPTLALGGLP